MRRRILLLSLATILVGIATAVDNSVTTVPVYSSEKHVEKQVVASPSSSPSPTPSATPQPQSQTIVAAAAPVTKKTAPVIQGNVLSIPSLGFQSSVVDVGVTAKNAIDVPGSQVGRWVGSSTPGTPGAVFLDGHVDGVFVRLNRVSVGQIVSLSYADQTFNYKVVFSEVVDLATIDMNRSLRVYGGSEGLNIMTCAGTYIPSQGTYDKRLVVYTVRLN